MVLLYKPRFKTPLECIEEYRAKNPELKDEKLSYAGRLDPMAEGLLLVLVGEECKRKDDYLGLPKEYEVAVLFGISTDTQDVFGVIEEAHQRDIDTHQAEAAVEDMIGTHLFPYPKFSSKAVDGTPLFQHALDNSLDDAEVPVREMTVHDISVGGWGSVSGAVLKELVKEACERIQGDFRYDAIRESWKKISDEQVFMTLSLTIDCASGTYMRTLAHEIGNRIGIPALAFSIKRIKIGEFSEHLHS